MPTKEEIQELFMIWKDSPKRCSCVEHSPNTNDKFLCPRELAWRNYTKARDSFIGTRQDERVKNKIDLADVLFALEDMQ